MPELSVLIPHKREARNNEALAVALSCLASNTTCDYELLIDATTPGDPYVLLNEMAQAARGEYLFFSNSDIFVSPAWDRQLLLLAEARTMVMATLVEPYAIGVHHENITANFGMRPDSFRRADFEAWCANGPVIPPGNGFYYYALIRRADFLSAGAFDTTLGRFPFPVDIHFANKWIAEGKRVRRSKALIYHLQSWSLYEEQVKAVRHEAGN